MPGAARAGTSLLGARSRVRGCGSAPAHPACTPASAPSAPAAGARKASGTPDSGKRLFCYGLHDLRLRERAESPRKVPAPLRDLRQTAWLRLLWAPLHRAPLTGGGLLCAWQTPTHITVSHFSLKIEYKEREQNPQHWTQTLLKRAWCWSRWNLFPSGGAPAGTFPILAFTSVAILDLQCHFSVSGQ